MQKNSLPPLLLLVDDEPTNLRLLIAALRQDHRIRIATRGEEALRIANDEETPDLILLDVMMPEMDGLEVIRRLRAQSKTRDIPVIFISADTSEESQLEGLRLGSNDYLTKPISPPLLLARVTNLLKRHQAEEQQRLNASVFDHASEAIMICNAKREVVTVNPTFCEITGYQEDDVIGEGSAQILQTQHLCQSDHVEMQIALDRHGKWSGEIWNRRKNGEEYASEFTTTVVKNSGGSITHYISIFSDITQFKTHQKRLDHMAHYDALTDLPNQVLLRDRLDLALARIPREQKILAICYLDLDNFKPVNDQYGHSVGDLLLIEISRRLKETIRAGDTAARLGGDEFILLLNELKDRQECEVVIQRLLGVLAEPISIDDITISITSSIGITLAPSDHADADTLIRHADQAMYQAKLSGRNRCHIFDPHHDQGVMAQNEALDQIKRALFNREFCLYYQPKVDMSNGKVIGFEALIRWQDPERGLIPPMDFLPLLFGKPLALEVDIWVFSEVLRQIDAWKHQGIHTGQISVNIGGDTLLSASFLNKVEDQMALYPHITPSMLEFEVLETSALEDTDLARDVLQQCQNMGFGVALDDFGTGYSSLTYFRHLPTDTLKIDQSFTRSMLNDPDDMAIVESVIRLTDAFDRKVIAEGVETTLMGAVLLHMGCKNAQGYGISRPMPADNVEEWLEHFTPDPGWQSLANEPWSRSNLPIKVAGMQHRQWISELDLLLEGAHSGDAETIVELDPHRCFFGRWYDNAGKRRFGSYSVFKTIEPIHEQVHFLGGRLIRQYKMGDLTAAQHTLTALHALRHHLLEHLDILCQQ